MRRAVNRMVGPTVDRILDRLDNRVTQADHLNLVNQVTERLIQEPASIYAPLMGVLRTGQDISEAFNSLVEDIKYFATSRPNGKNRFEMLQGIEEVQVAACFAANLKPDVTLMDALQRSLPVARWQTTPEARATARHAFALLFVGGRLGLVDTKAFSKVFPDLLEDLPLPRWFSSKGRYYGTSFAFRWVLTCVQFPDVFPQAQTVAVELTDRLIRHIEVNRADALEFNVASLPMDAQPLLEKLRFTVGLLEAGDLFSDIRYLNTALKVVDLHYFQVKPLLKSEPWNAVSHAIAWHYVFAVHLQERLMESLV